MSSLQGEEQKACYELVMCGAASAMFWSACTKQAYYRLLLVTFFGELIYRTKCMTDLSPRKYLSRHKMKVAEYSCGLLVKSSTLGGSISALKHPAMTYLDPRNSRIERKSNTFNKLSLQARLRASCLRFLLCCDSEVVLHHSKMCGRYALGIVCAIDDLQLSSSR